MYLHLGGDVVVRSSDIIGIFDIENTSVSKLTKEYLGEQEKRHRSSPFPRSCPNPLLCAGKGMGLRCIFHRFPVLPCANEAALSTGWD